MNRFVAIFFILVLLVFAFIDRGQIAGDGTVRWNALVSLMKEGRLTNDKYIILQPLLSVPLYLAGSTWYAISHPTVSAPGQAETDARLKIAKTSVQRFNKIVAFLITVVFYLLLRKLFSFSFRQAAWATIFLLFGSLLIPSAKDYYSECLGTFLILISLQLMAKLTADHDIEKPSIILAYIGSTSLAIMLSPVVCVPLGALLLFILIKSEAEVRNSIIIAGATSIFLGIALFTLENLLRRGSILDFGYHAEQFSTPLFTGLAGMVASPARGIIFFIPSFFVGFALLTLRPPSSLQGTYLIDYSLTYSLMLLLTYSKWHDWHGGGYWGPRYLFPLSIFGTLYVVLFVRQYWSKSSASKIACLSILALCIAVYKVGVSVNQQYLLPCFNATQNPSDCFWDVHYLPYYSFFDAHELKYMFLHRSSLVEIVVLVLAGVLLRLESQSHRLPSNL